MPQHKTYDCICQNGFIQEGDRCVDPAEKTEDQENKPQDQNPPPLTDDKICVYDESKDFSTQTLHKRCIPSKICFQGYRHFSKTPNLTSFQASQHAFEVQKDR